MFVSELGPPAALTSQARLLDLSSIGPISHKEKAENGDLFRVAMMGRGTKRSSDPQVYLWGPDMRFGFK